VISEITGGSQLVDCSACEMTASHAIAAGRNAQWLIGGSFVPVAYCIPGLYPLRVPWCSLRWMTVGHSIMSTMALCFRGLSDLQAVILTNWRDRFRYAAYVPTTYHLPCLQSLH